MCQLMGGRDASKLLSPYVIEPVAAVKKDEKQDVDIDDYFLPADNELDSYFQASSGVQIAVLLPIACAC